MKKRDLRLFVTSLVTLSPIAVGLLLWNRLPDHMITHWGFGGEADGGMPKAWAIVVLPLFSFLMHMICIWVISLDPKNKDQSAKVSGMIYWICPWVSLIGQGLILGTAMGLTLDVSRIFLILLGLMFLVFGNYLPKCKQNHTIGVRIPWVYTSDANWNETHRLAGKLWVICGLLFLPSAFLPAAWVPYVLLLLFLPMAIVPVVVSYRIYRKQVQNGEIPKRIPVKPSKATVIILVWIALVVVGSVIVSLLFS